jgi:hypothetical protein
MNKVIPRLTAQQLKSSILQEEMDTLSDIVGIFEGI